MSVGQLGRRGSGVAEHFGLECSGDLVIGTFAKAFSSSGGYLVGRQALIDEIRYERAAAFSTGLSPLNAFITHKMVELFERVGPELVGELQAKAALWRAGLRERGLEIGESQTAIVPVLCQPSRVRDIHATLMRHGIYAMPIEPPWSQTLHGIRTSVTARHSRYILEKSMDTFGASYSGGKYR